MKAFISRIVPQHPTAVALQWELEEVSESGSFSFEIDRSGSPEGPWTTITTIVDLYTYSDLLEDEEANTLSIARDIYYRIGAIPPSGQPNKVYSPVTNLDGLSAYTVDEPWPAVGYVVNSEGQREPAPYTNAFQRPTAAGRKRLIKRAIQRKQYIGLKKLYGTEFWLLKKRHFGTRCSACYRSHSRLVTKKACTVCYGTSWTGGYFNAIDLLGKRETAPVQSMVTPQSKDDILRTQILLMDFPRLDEGDLLVEKHANRRWLVSRRDEITRKGILVEQVVSVSEIGHKSIEYSIPVVLS